MELQVAMKGESAATHAQSAQDRMRAEQLVRLATMLVDREERKQVLRQALDLEISAAQGASPRLEEVEVAQRIGESEIPEDASIVHRVEENRTVTLASVDKAATFETVPRTPIRQDAIRNSTLNTGRVAVAAVAEAKARAPKASAAQPRTNPPPSMSSTPASSQLSTHESTSATCSPSSSIWSQSTISLDSETGRRKPKKLEIRAVKSELTEGMRKKPKKLEIRVKK